MKPLTGKRKKEEGLLTAMAESIGSTMGTIVGRANAAQKALSKSPEVRRMKRKVRKLGQKTTKAGRKTKTKR